MPRSRHAVLLSNGSCTHLPLNKDAPLGGRDTTLRARIDEHFARFDVILDVPLEVEDVALQRSIVAQSNFVSAFQTHHVFNELRNGTLARISYVQTHERQPVGYIRISDHTDLSRKLVDLLRCNYESAALKYAKWRRSGHQVSIGEIQL